MLGGMFSESGFSRLQETKAEAVSGTGPAVWGRAVVSTGVSGLGGVKRRQRL